MSYILPIVDDFYLGRIISGQGAYIYTNKGKFLDAFCDNGVVSLGYDFYVADEELPHLPEIVRYKKREKAAETLCKTAGMDMAFFHCSGSEGVETMMKFARRAQNRRERTKIFVHEGAFHGRTYGAMSASPTGKDYHFNGYHPLLPNVYTFRNFSDIDDDAAAIIMTPAEVYKDYIRYDKLWLENIINHARMNKILICIDEVQTYVRTGKWWGYQKWPISVEPDMICVAKGVAGGYPTGMTLMKKTVGRTIEKGGHFSTFGGNPKSCQGVLQVAERCKALLNDNGINWIESRGRQMRAGLNKIEGVRNIRGEGLFTAFDIDMDSVKFRNECLDRKLIIGVFSKNSPIKLTPPLNLSASDVDKIVEVIKDVIDSNRGL